MWKMVACGPNVKTSKEEKSQVCSNNSLWLGEKQKDSS